MDPFPSSKQRETFSKHPSGAKALHACESSPPRLATSCLGESGERRERHTAPRWRNLQSLLRIPPHSSSFFIPSLCLLKHLLGKLDARESPSLLPPPRSAKLWLVPAIQRGAPGSPAAPDSPKDGFTPRPHTDGTPGACPAGWHPASTETPRCCERFPPASRSE